MHNEFVNSLYINISQLPTKLLATKICPHIVVKYKYW